MDRDEVKKFNKIDGNTAKHLNLWRKAQSPENAKNLMDALNSLASYHGSVERFHLTSNGDPETIEAKGSPPIQAEEKPATPATEKRKK